MKNLVRMKLEAQEVVTGPFVGINSPDMVEILGLSGFDLCVIDTEHGPMDPESIQPLIRAAELSGMTPWSVCPVPSPWRYLRSSTWVPTVSTSPRSTRPRRPGW